MNQPNPYESTNAEQQGRKQRSNMVFVLLAGLTLLCMLFVFALFFSVRHTQVKSMPIPPAQPSAGK